MSFSVALSGLNSATTDLRVTSNNIANANTTAFKSSRAEFADVFTGAAVGTGAGVRLSQVRQDFAQGNVEITERQLDLAISGKGFFVLGDGGSRLYSRAGSFGLNPQGFVQNAEGERLQVYEPIATGGFNQGQLIDLRIQSETLPPVASTLVDMNVNLPAGAQPPTVSPFTASDPESYNHSTSTVVFDSLGVAHTATYFFIKTPAGWDVATAIDGNVSGTPQPVAFSANGTVTSPANGLLSYPAYDPGNGAVPMTIGLDLSRSTQFGGNFVVNSLNPDGQAEGRLRNIEIDQTGVVLARFSNGRSTAIGKIALADFPNPEGLLKISDASFQQTFNSGNPTLGEATESTFGLIQSGGLETSNVDLTEELVNTITAQRLFQANARVISTLDEITQTIINI
ncbi:MAG: flagellar hook protein FlgE [Chromatiales bacterium]|jgi:flagellar hook protein FlgE|nr:flagellar hook protein FlgE [Chromatiales bacterium]